MAQVDVTINGRTYQIACDDGQEQHLVALAAYVDRRVGELTAAMGQIGDARLLVMASLLIADELAEIQAAGAEGTAQSSTLPANMEATLADGIEALARRIEEIAARLEAA
jgi:cell division protein ZapA